MRDLALTLALALALAAGWVAVTAWPGHALAVTVLALAVHHARRATSRDRLADVIDGRWGR